MYNYLTLTRIAGGFLFRSARISVGKYSLDLNRLKPIKNPRHQTDAGDAHPIPLLRGETAAENH